MPGPISPLPALQCRPRAKFSARGNVSLDGALWIVTGCFALSNDLLTASYRVVPRCAPRVSD
jgi:hypothetical protein